MQILQVNNTEITEILSDNTLINNTEDGIDLVGNLYFRQIDKVILHQENISPQFFDLKTGMAGEILQKFSNYRIRLAILGDFTNIESKSMRDFISESNKFGHINFVQSREEAIEKLSK